jgi:putative glutamine amidotransferase
MKILVTASRGMAASEYLDAVREAGGEPVRVDPGSENAGVVFQDAQALLVTGGVDVDPAAYHAAASPYVTETEPERDILEIELLHEARRRRMPTLCICRGMQVANVAFGGTLIDDIPARLGERAVVRHQIARPDGITERGLVDEHVVRLKQDATLTRIVGTTELRTGARHHQAVERIANDLRAVGSTRDGIVEALEACFPSPFWIAVQWHPESTRQLDHGASRALFATFVQAAIAATQAGSTSQSSPHSSDKPA